MATGPNRRNVYQDMGTKITKRAVDQLSPLKPILWDSAIKGFGIRRRSSGSKFYVLKTRIGGRQRWLTIGRHGSPWTPESARREAMRLLGLRAAGRDPASLRDCQKGAITIAQFGTRFLSEYVRQHCKARTAEEYRRALELHINPMLGQQRIADLTRADVARLHHQLRDRPYQSNRNLAVLSKMMNLAEQWGLRSDGSNPIRHIKKHREEKRERSLSSSELKKLGAALASVQASGENPFAIAAIWLLILTGARLSEILNLRWAHVDIENSVLRLPDSKTGAKSIFLNDAAIALLRTVPRLDGNGYVIVGKKLGSPMVNLQNPWRRLRSAAGLADVRIHDLRHSFASVAVGEGMSLPMLGKLLGHTQPATTARYAHLGTVPLLDASNLIGSKIAALMRNGNAP